MMLVYIDTSALAKWYLNEPRSEDFEAFIRQQASAAISRLAVSSSGACSRAGNGQGSSTSALKTAYSPLSRMTFARVFWPFIRWMIRRS